MWSGTWPHRLDPPHRRRGRVRTRGARRDGRRPCGASGRGCGRRPPPAPTRGPTPTPRARSAGRPRAPRRPDGGEHAPGGVEHRADLDLHQPGCGACPSARLGGPPAPIRRRRRDRLGDARSDVDSEQAHGTRPLRPPRSGPPSSPSSPSSCSAPAGTGTPRCRRRRARFVLMFSMMYVPGLAEQVLVDDEQPARRLRRPRLEGPVVGADQRHAALRQPVRAVPAEPRLEGAVARVVDHPQRRPAGVEQHDVAGADVDALPLAGRLDVLRGDRESLLEHRRPLEGGDVEADAARHPLRRVLDAEPLQAGRRVDVPVVQAVVVPPVDADVAEPVEVAADLVRRVTCSSIEDGRVRARGAGALLERVVGQEQLVPRRGGYAGMPGSSSCASSMIRPCVGIRSAASVRSGVSSWPAPSSSSAPYRDGHHGGLEGPEPSYAAGALVSVIAASKARIACGGRLRGARLHPHRSRRPPLGRRGREVRPAVPPTFGDDQITTPASRPGAARPSGHPAVHHGRRSRPP